MAKSELHKASLVFARALAEANKTKISRSQQRPAGEQNNELAVDANAAEWNVALAKWKEAAFADKIASCEDEKWSAIKVTNLEL